MLHATNDYYIIFNRNDMATSTGLLSTATILLNYALRYLGFRTFLFKLKVPSRVDNSRKFPEDTAYAPY